MHLRRCVGACMYIRAHYNGTRMHHRLLECNVSEPPLCGGPRSNFFERSIEGCTIHVALREREREREMHARRSIAYRAITPIYRRENSARHPLNWMHLSCVSHDPKWCALKRRTFDLSNGKIRLCLFKRAIVPYKCSRWTACSFIITMCTRLYLVLA